MAKTPNKNSKNTNPEIDLSITPEGSVTFNMTVSKTFFNRLTKYKDLLNFSSEQEAVRVGMNIFLKKQGF